MGFRFGLIQSIDPATTVVCFVIVVAFIIVFEHATELLEVLLEENHVYSKILQIVYKELMLMGVISFSIVMYQASKPDNLSEQESSAIESIDFAHIVLFYMTFFFVLHAFYLIRISIDNFHRNRVHYAETAASLLQKIDAVERRPWWSPARLLYHSEFFLTALRDKVEFKVVQSIFFALYLVPRNFDYPAYVTRCYERYALKTITRSLLSWLVLLLAVLANYLRLFAGYSCTIHGVVEAEHRRWLSAPDGYGYAYGGEDVDADNDRCRKLTMREFLAGGALLTLFNLCLLVAARVYKLRLVHFVGTSNSADFREYLEYLHSFEEEHKREIRSTRRFTTRELFNEIATTLAETEHHADEETVRVLAKLFHRLAAALRNVYTDAVFALRLSVVAACFPQRRPRKRKSILTAARKPKPPAPAPARTGCWPRWSGSDEAPSGDSKAAAPVGGVVFVQGAAADAEACAAQPSEGSGRHEKYRNASEVLSLMRQRQTLQSIKQRVCVGIDNELPAHAAAPQSDPAAPRAGDRPATEPFHADLDGLLSDDDEHKSEHPAAHAAHSDSQFLEDVREEWFKEHSFRASSLRLQLDDEDGDSDGDGDGDGDGAAKAKAKAKTAAGPAAQLLAAFAAGSPGRSDAAAGGVEASATSPRRNCPVRGFRQMRSQPAATSPPPSTERDAATVSPLFDAARGDGDGEGNGDGDGDAATTATPPDAAALNSATAQEQLRSIFLFHRPELFFRAIELGIMFSCLFMALWVTNALSIVRDIDERGAYVSVAEVLVVLPIALHFYTLPTITSTCALVHAISDLNLHAAHQVLQDSLETQRLLRRVRKKVLARAAEAQEAQKAEQLARNEQRKAEEEETRRRLEALVSQLLSLDHTIDRIQRAIAYHTYLVQRLRTRWQQVAEPGSAKESPATSNEADAAHQRSVTLHVQLQAEIASEAKRLTRLQHKLAAKQAERADVWQRFEKLKTATDSQNLEQRRRFIDELFEELDQDGSGSIDHVEFRDMLRHLHLTLSDHKFRLLFRAIDRTTDGGIEREELMEFLFPSLSRQIIDLRHFDAGAAADAAPRSARSRRPSAKSHRPSAAAPDASSSSDSDSDSN
eukprot:gene12501-8937_t